MRLTIIASLVGLLAFGAFLTLPAKAFAEDVQEITYEQNGVTLTGTSDGEVITITGSSSEDKFYAVDIPESIDGLPVCAIDANAFQSNAFITSVSLPSGVTELPNMAFYQCSALKSIDLNQVQSMGDIYSSWTVLGGTWSLETITVATDNPALTVEDGVLFDKDMTTLMVYPTLKPDTSYVIPESVTTLWERAFNRSQYLEEVTLSSGITQYNYSFFHCPVLKTMNLNMLSFIGGNNFSECTALETVTVSDNNENFFTRRGVLFSKDSKTLYFYPPARQGDSYTIPDGVTTIMDKAFMQCKLKQINLPQTLKTVNGNAFSFSEQLEELIFPEGVTFIGTNACTGCESLKAVYIPDSVTYIAPGSLDGPIAGPYAEVYGNAYNAAGEHTYAYEFVKQLNDQWPGDYVFKDIKDEKMPRVLEITSEDRVTLDEDTPAFDIGVQSMAELTFESSAPDIVQVDDHGILKPLKSGEATISIIAPEDIYHRQALKTVHVTVDMPEPVKDPVRQTIKGASKFTKNYGCKAFALKQTAKTKLTFRSSNRQIATVTKAGNVKILRPGTVKIYVTAVKSTEYAKATKTITIKAKLKTPALKVTRKSRAVKLTWGKVPKAAAYQLYVKFPGSKKFERVLTESYKVKSVTHRGLTKGKTYKYKLRAVTKVNGKKYYSAFSKIRTVKIR